MFINLLLVSCLCLTWPITRKSWLHTLIVKCFLPFISQHTIGFQIHSFTQNLTAPRLTQPNFLLKNPRLNAVGVTKLIFTNPNLWCLSQFVSLHSSRIWNSNLFSSHSANKILASLLSFFPLHISYTIIYLMKWVLLWKYIQAGVGAYVHPIIKKPRTTV